MLADDVAAAAMPMLATRSSIAVTVTVIVPSAVLLETRINGWMEFDLGVISRKKEKNTEQRHKKQMRLEAARYGTWIADD